jgi:tetratricopeptide (TPR) repeat protein
MLFALLTRYLPSGPSLAAVSLFAVHPVHVEPVAFISGRTDLLAVFFLLGALLLLLLRPGERLGWSRMLCGSFLFFLSGLSKEIGLVLPAVTLAVWWRDEGLKVALKRTIPLLFLLATMLFLRSAALRHGAGLGSWEISHFQWQEYPPLALQTLRLLFFPVKLLPYYVVRPLPPAGILAVGGLLLILLYALARLGKSRAWDTSFILGTTLFLASLVTILPLFRKQGAIIADRFLYLPSVGLSVLAGCLWELAARKTFLESVRRNRALVFGLAAVPVAFMLPWSMIRSTDWRDDETLFTRSLARDPENPVFHYHLGDLYNRRQQYDKAEPFLRRAVELNPAFHMSRLVLADFYAARGRETQAAALYSGILAEDPTVYMARFGLAMIAFQRGDYRGAIPEFEAVVRQVPSFKVAWTKLGDSWLRLGRSDLAVRYWKMASRNP